MVLGVIEIKTSDHKRNGEEILSYDKKKKSSPMSLICEEDDATLARS